MICVFRDRSLARLKRNLSIKSKPIFAAIVVIPYRLENKALSQAAGIYVPPRAPKPGGTKGLCSNI
jgi:hypothetical protein